MAIWFAWEQNSFTFKPLCRKTHSETEANSNSEMGLKNILMPDREKRKKNSNGFDLPHSIENLSSIFFHGLQR